MGLFVPKNFLNEYHLIWSAARFLYDSRLSYCTNTNVTVIIYFATPVFSVMIFLDSDTVVVKRMKIVAFLTFYLQKIIIAFNVHLHTAL